ncbi:MAG: hypothetical protein J3K34DRAFT_526045 [Monoraphidium minutum]|nr:MAG: hypothetical protein J3K34DRAFT_526045 [Monoraphidium minutum]
MSRRAAALLGRLAVLRGETNPCAAGAAVGASRVHAASDPVGTAGTSRSGTPRAAAFGAALVAAFAAAAPAAAAEPPPLSGAPAALDERGLTNHPLDYDPVTNEHTAAMTLARKAAVEAYEAGRFDEAEVQFRLALSEARKGFPPDDLHIPSALNMLAEFYRNTRRHEEAAALYKEALALLEEATGEKHWMYASALVNLALCEEEAGDLPAATALLERAYTLRRVLFGPASVPYADTAFTLGRVLRAGAGAAAAGGGCGGGGGGGWFGGAARGAAAEAARQQERWLALMGEAVRVLTESGDPSGTPLLDWEMAYADALRAAGRDAEAAQQLAAAVGHLAAAKGEAAAQASEISERLVDALEASGQLPAATAAMRACADARAALFGRHLVVAKSMARASRLLLAGGGGGGAGGAEVAALAQGYAAGAVALAEETLSRGGGGGSGGGGGGGVRGLLGGLFGGGGKEQKAAAAADALAERARARLELAGALQALAAANAALAAAGGGGEGGDGEAALRRAVGVARAAAADGADELRALAAQQEPGAAPLPLDKAAGLLVDTQLLLLELLEALAAQLQAAAAPAGARPRGGGGGGGAAAEEAAALLAEAEAVAAELSGA